MKSLSFTFQVSAHNFLASHGLQQTYLGLRFINQSKAELFDLPRSSAKQTINDTKDVGFVCTVRFDHARSTQCSVLFQVLSDNEVYRLLVGRITELVGLFSPFEEIFMLEQQDSSVFLNSWWDVENPGNDIHKPFTNSK